MAMRIAAVALSLSALLLPCAGAAAEGPAPANGVVPVDDFEGAEVKPAWSSEEADLRVVQGPTGGALEISAKGQVKDSRARASVLLPVKDLRKIGSVAFRLENPSGPASIQFFLRKGTTYRTLEEWYYVQKRDWQDVVLPLRLMAPGSSGLLPDGADLDRFEVQWVGGGVVRIDDLRLLPGDRGEESWRPSDADLLEMAFGKGKGRVLAGKRFSILTEQSSWQGPDAAKFLSDCEAGVALLEARFGLAAPPGTRVPIFGVSDQAESVAVRGNVLAHYRAEGLFPANALDRTFEFWGIADRSLNKGMLGRPTGYGMSAYIGRALGMRHRNAIVVALYWSFQRRASEDELKNWLRSGNGVSAEDFQALLRGKPDRIPPWSRLFGDASTDQRSAALMTVTDFLAANHRSKLPRVWDALRALEGDPDSETPGAMAKALGTTAAKLEEQWMRWGATSWR